VFSIIISLARKSGEPYKRAAMRRKDVLLWGWLLMLPPIKTVGCRAFGTERDIADVNAPTSAWLIRETYDVYDACERDRASVSQYTADYIQRQFTRAEDEPTERQLARLQLRFAASRCVHDENDVRAKEWLGAMPDNGYQLPLGPRVE